MLLDRGEVAIRNACCDEGIWNIRNIVALYLLGMLCEERRRIVAE
jgi:hypothetical protein